ncbi:glutamyl-tRNA reductase [Synechococcales cyanobacterium C]|uniref:Glutamyl-tRNA reductase n=1 Tax=Petrachloros mirabilis ULC683 TaxID=2781853 RepID=A0A8K1ZWL1_9CYAN|nr:glutamyl-tRNA reductase [Petrachloros mirabilis]NCJ06494.1 glutamyl-tRNA reductase [Petrachloros mirabilis ULC683]
MNIVVVGLSHKTAPVEIREQLSVPDDAKEKALNQLRSYPHIEEAAVLSTCNRLEVYIVTPETESGIRELTQFLCDWSHLSPGELRPHLFILLHQDAVMHLMRVSAGLDSLVLGEGQILAQVKETHRLAQQYNGSGPLLNRLFKQAISAGKRVRTETSIGTGAVSISSAAVELAQVKIDNLMNCRVAIIGAGKMSRLLVKHLLSKGASQITILNRSLKRAEDLARQFQEATLQLQHLSEMELVLAEVDLVFTSTAATEPLLDRRCLEPILTHSRNLMIVDISVPRNVHANVNELDRVHVFNVDDLKAVVAQNQESRRQMAMEAEALLEEELDAFDVWWRSLETVPTISSLRAKIEQIREQELEKALSRLGTEFAEKHQEVIEALTRGIVNKILHDPMVQLRAQQDIEARRKAMQSLQMLFNLSSPAQSPQKF